MTNTEISDYIFIEDKDLKGDIAIIFGNYKAYKNAVEVAAGLYKDKLCPKVLFTGGVNKHSGVIEAEVMAEYALQCGIDHADILVENKASNTLENVTYSLAMIQDQIGFNEIHNIVIVVKNYHARRAAMTLKKHLPSHIAIKVAGYRSTEYDFDKNDWMLSEIGRNKVSEELENISKYLAKGDLVEL